MEGSHTRTEQPASYCLILIKNAPFFPFPFIRRVSLFPILPYLSPCPSSGHLSSIPWACRVYSLEIRLQNLNSSRLPAQKFCSSYHIEGPATPYKQTTYQNTNTFHLVFQNLTKFQIMMNLPRWFFFSSDVRLKCQGATQTVQKNTEAVIHHKQISTSMPSNKLYPSRRYVQHMKEKDKWRPYRPRVKQANSQKAAVQPPQTAVSSVLSGDERLLSSEPWQNSKPNQIML